MSLHFHPLEGSVLLCSRGQYTEAKLFLNRGVVYAGNDRSKVRLLGHGATSVNGVTWYDIQPAHAYVESQGHVIQHIPQLTSAA